MVDAREAYTYMNNLSIGIDCDDLSLTGVTR